MQTQQRPIISVLVPCYNVEKFLPQCLDSIVNQTLKNIEIICINDGSTDSTLDIIKKYAATDSRFVIIDKPNEGYGKSMNRGLDCATGKYVGIVESDDWVDADMFEKLVNIAETNNVQVVKSDFYRYTTTDGEKNVIGNVIPVAEANRVICPRRNYSIFWSQPSIWSAIYRRDFLNDNHIRFLESPGASYQDLGFNFKIWAMANSVYLTTNAYLHYRCDNENSSVKSTGKVFCVCDEWAEIERFLTANGRLHQFIKFIPHIKMGNYVWNKDRLCGDARRDFMRRFQIEYKTHIQNHELEKIYFDDKMWNKMMISIYPYSVYHRIRKHLFDIIRVIYKTRIRNSKKEYIILSKIVVGRKQLPELLIGTGN